MIFLSQNKRYAAARKPQTHVRNKKKENESGREDKVFDLKILNKCHFKLH